MKKCLDWLFIALFIVSAGYAQSPEGILTHFTPLDDLGTGTYRGYQGGLYPNGLNLPPAAHSAAGISIAKQIRPLDSLGVTDPVNGKIVLLSVGMSNTTQEFSFFKSMADTDRIKNPKLQIVDGAQGGQTASIISNPAAPFWSIIDQRLWASKVSAKQVQIVWFKEANANPTDPFPKHADVLVNQFVTIAQIIRSRYPNIKIMYSSSRTYGGYATSKLNPEPYAYESAFAVKWFIEKQISGDTSLVYTGINPRSPWLAWGPYLWADSLNPRSDGLIWQLDDFVTSDRTHPSPSGRLKVAQLLLGFLKTDPTAIPWFVQSEATAVSGNHVATPSKIILEQNYPNPFFHSTSISFSLPKADHVTLKIFNFLGQEIIRFIDDELYDAGTHTIQFDSRTMTFALLPGVYFYQMTTSDYRELKRMVLMR